jgi:parallel beta-helix repeat protein
MRKKCSVFIKKIIIGILILNLLRGLVQTVSSEQINENIIYVGKSGAGNFSTIQEGIDAADIGDTIYVYNGTYFENIVIDKSITLVGENKRNTIIDGRVAGNVIKVNAGYVTIKNFTIQHCGHIFPNSGINLSSNYNIIENNLIIDNFYGMTLYKASSNTIRGNIIQNDLTCGIYMSKSSKNTIINNTIQNNTYNGIGLYDSSDENTIKSNNFKNNDFCGVNIRISSDNMIIANSFIDNYIGIHLPRCENFIEDNYFSGNEIDIDREFFLSESESILILGIIVALIIIGVIFYRKIKKKRK